MLTKGFRWGPEREQESDESRSGSYRVGQESDGHVSVSQTLSHDSRAHDDGEECSRADALGHRLLQQHWDLASATPLGTQQALAVSRITGASAFTTKTSQALPSGSSTQTLS